MAAKTRRKTRRESDENQRGQGIPDDLIMGIFERLPAKSIGRFRCLCKIWVSYLSDPEFINRHAHAVQAKEQKLFFHVLETRSLYKLNPETLTDDSSMADMVDNAEKIIELRGMSSYRMVGSCSGLLCLQRHVQSHETFLLLNPLTRESRKISLQLLRREQAVRSGFGYDQYNKDYKIVRYKDLGIDNEYDEFDVFSLKKDSWTTIRQEPTMPQRLNIYMLSTACVEVGGFLHWGPVPRSEFYTVFTFDLAREIGGELILNVPTNNHNREIDGLCVFDGRLCATVLESENQFGDLNCVIWMMKEYGIADSWIPLMQLSLPSLPALSFNDRGLFPICYMKKKGSVLLLLPRKYLRLIYNLQDESYTIGWLPKVLREPTAFFETLVSPNSL